MSSPYLPRVEEVAESHGRVAALEEYVQGDTLLYLLEGGLLDWPEARKVARDLCAALWVLHSMGAVHRDVKESNVILRGGEAVLVDFDASRIMKPELHSDTVILGTTGYAAPEQFGLSQTDGRADIYSLGVLLNVMLTGQHPSPLLAEGHAGRIVRRCTMMNPDQRFRDVLELRTLCEVAVENRKKCIRCGALLPQEASFCPCCTASQLAREPMSRPAAKSAAGRWPARCCWRC